MPTAFTTISNFVPSHEIRKMVARGFSDMYKGELPEYNRFTAPVTDSNLEQLPAHASDPRIKKETLMEEKHGAIRVPGPEEMRIATRIFAQMGMIPVEFYDMTILGEKSLPMIATAFRPADKTIEESAFRMFCSMLHVDSIPVELKNDVLAELESNRARFPKFSAELLALLDKAERPNGGLSEDEAIRFATLVVDSFSMHKDKVVDFKLYSKLRNVSDPLADIVLESPVLNHLTPRALDIQDAVAKLVQAGIPMQTVIQGPPIGEDGVSIQLNQIARIAAGEDVFVSADPVILEAFGKDPSSLAELKAVAPRLELDKGEKVGDYMSRIAEALKTNQIVVIQHKARFGEIESRGVALTVEGEQAYNSYGIESETDPTLKKTKIERFKTEYPKTHYELHDKGWAYYTYQVTEAGCNAARQGIKPGLGVSELLGLGYISLVPQTYDDFLPFSAAAIFRANLTEGTKGIEDSKKDASKNKKQLETAMGTTITSRHDIHQRDWAQSVNQVYDELNILPPRMLKSEIDRSLARSSHRK